MAQHATARDQLAVNYKVGDAQRLPYPDGAFDVAYYADTLGTTHDLNGVVAEAARVLPEGAALLYDTVTRTRLSRVVHLGALQSWRWTRVMPKQQYSWERLRPPMNSPPPWPRRDRANLQVDA